MWTWENRSDIWHSKHFGSLDEAAIEYATLERFRGIIDERETENDRLLERVKTLKLGGKIISGLEKILRERSRENFHLMMSLKDRQQEITEEIYSLSLSLPTPPTKPTD